LVSLPAFALNELNPIPSAADGYQNGMSLSGAYFVPSSLDPSRNVVAGETCCRRTGVYWRVNGFASPTACVSSIWGDNTSGIPGAMAGGASALGSAVYAAAGMSAASRVASIPGTAVSGFEAGVLYAAAAACSASVCIQWGTYAPCTIYPCMWFGLGYNTLCCQ